ncbi:30S ribosomal protein S6 [Patescibacteria group bacterium]|nr:MAG: 30S ribosomal protein S6 [Patescibacteria group bacterium]
MQKYELLLVLPGTLDDQEAAARLAEIVEMIKAHGQYLETNNIGKMRLAYPIKQIRYGYFYAIVFEAVAPAVKELEVKLKAKTNLLRAIVAHFKTNVTAAKKIMYTTSEAGVTTMMEKSEDGVRPLAEERKGPVDLKDIDKKLDEILGGDVIPGV